MTLAGIEPVTFLSVAQHLNHCAAASQTNICYFFMIYCLLELSFKESIAIANVD